MLKICLVFWESEPQYDYKLYGYKKNMYLILSKDRVHYARIAVKHCPIL